MRFEFQIHSKSFMPILIFLHYFATAEANFNTCPYTEVYPLGWVIKIACPYPPGVTSTRLTYPSAMQWIGFPTSPWVLKSTPPWKWLERSSPKLPLRVSGKSKEDRIQEQPVLPVPVQWKYCPKLLWLYNFVKSFSLFYGELITKILNLSANLQIKNRISLKIMLLNIHLLRKNISRQNLLFWHFVIFEAVKPLKCDNYDSRNS